MTGWLTCSLAEVPAEDGWLGPSERAVLARLTLLRRRTEWRLGRYTAKAAAAAFLEVEDGRIEVVASPGGAPVAVLDGTRARLELSLSHRAGRAVAVVAPPGPALGCDLELVEPRSTAFVRQWFADGERALVEAAPPDERPWLANLIWSAKEAATKAIGEGLRLDVARARVTFGLGAAASDADGWRALRVQWGDDAATVQHGWFLREPGWVITVVGGDSAAPPPRRIR